MLEEAVRPIKRRILSRGYKVYGDVIAKMMDLNSIAPAVIIWEPTMRCNLECAMCGHNQQGLLNVGVKEELSLEEIQAAIQNIKRAYRYLPFLPFVGFTGGEPFMRKDLEDIGASLSKEGFKYSITSNFTAAIPKRIDKLLLHPPSDMRISIDGVGEKHNRVRGKGMFEKTFAHAKYFVEASKGKIPLHINCAISPISAYHLSEVVDVAAELGADLRFQHAIFTTPAMEQKQREFAKENFGTELIGVGDCLEYSEKTVEAIIEQLHKARERAKEKGVFMDALPWLGSDEHVRKYYMDVEGWVMKPTCHSAWSTLRISSNGDVYPCIKEVVGNIRRDEFGAVVNGDGIKHFRAVIKEKKRMPACHRCCKL